MNKIKALYTNEIIKILHRPSVFIVAVFTLVLAFAFPFLMRIVFIGDYSEVFEIYTKEKFEEDLAGYKTELKNANLKTTKETVEIEVKGQANNQKDHCRHADQGHQNPRLNMPAFFHGVSSNRKPNPHTAAILTPQPSSLCRSLLTVSSVARVSTAVSKPQTAFSRSSRDTA